VNYGDEFFNMEEYCDAQEQFASAGRIRQDRLVDDKLEESTDRCDSNDTDNNAVDNATTD